MPASFARLAVGGERDDRLHGDVRVDASVGEAELPASDILQEERANPFAIERALRVVTDAGVGEEVREVVPQAQFRVVAVGVLESLDCGDGFDPLRQRVESIDALLQQGQIRIGAADACPERSRRVAAAVHAAAMVSVARV